MYFASDRAGLEQTLFLIPLFPLVGFLINGLFGKSLDKKASGWLAVFASLASFVWAARCVGALDVPMTDSSPEIRNALHYVYGDWLNVQDFSFSFGLYLDQLSSVMILVVTGIGTLIHIYSMGYMAHDAGLSRFFAYLNLFLFAMILLVLGDNLIVLFVGWEGVGLCSYLLIGFWYEEDKNAAAGMKAFVVNRIGDLGFLLGIFLLLAVFGTVDFASRPSRQISGASHVTRQTTIEASVVKVPPKPGLLDYAEALRMLSSKDPQSKYWLVGHKSDPLVSNLDLSKTVAVRTWPDATLGFVITLICVLLFVGAMGKSAQIPLYVWLPDAMAGPTPVSALIHAATMVTAGVYMVCRLHGLFALSPEALQMIAVIGGSTALMAALIGLTQLDIKKVLAYSTVSQLGYMFLGLGVGMFSLGIFHVFTHAFFKALLFLCAGSVIHAMSGEQDMRYMGGLRTRLPKTFWCMLIGAFALAGMPPFAGYFSKDEILMNVLARYEDTHKPLYLVLYIFGIVAAFCTAFYTFRLIFLTFFGENRSKPEVRAHIHESPPAMTFPLIVLAGFSVFAGFYWKDKFTADVNGLTSIGVRNIRYGAVDLHHVHQINFVVTLLIAISGIAAAWLVYFKNKKVPDPEKAKTHFLYRLSLNKFYVDEAYDWLIIWPFKLISELTLWIVEMLFIDLIVTGSGYAVAMVSAVLRRVQTGLLNFYAAAILTGAVAILMYLNW